MGIVPVLLVFVRAVIGATFVTSLVAKATSVNTFAEVLPKFGVPRRARFAVVGAVLAAEGATCAAMIIGGPTLVAGLALAAALLTIFSLALLRNLTVGDRTTNCNCFGASTKFVSWLDLYRDLGLLALIGAGYGVAKFAYSADFGGAGGLVTAPLGLSLIAAIAGVVLAVFVVYLEDVVALFRTTGWATIREGRK